jgi:hypothetical protein
MANDGYDNIEEIADAIFSRPPGRPHGVQLQLEEETADLAQQSGVDEFVFNILYLITFKGIEKLYGHRKVQDLTESQFRTVQEYVNSYGYVLTVEANGTNKTPWQLRRDGVVVLNYRIGFDRLI